MIVRHDSQLPPTIYNSQQTEVVVLQLLLRHLAQTKFVQQIIAQQQLLTFFLRMGAAKHRISSRIHPLAQLPFIARQEQLEQLGHGLGVLFNLLLGVWVQDGKTCVHVPLVGVDAKRDVDLDVLDAANVARRLPRELVVGGPRGAHAEEGRMGDGLRVGSDAVVLLAGKVDVLGLEAGENGLDEGEVGVRGAVLDQHEGLAFGVYARPVEGVAGYNADVCREVLFKCCNLWGLA